MNSDEIKLIYRSHDEAMLAGKLDIIDDLYADDFVNYSPGMPDFLRHGPNAVRGHYGFLAGAFSDMALNVDQEIVDGDKLGMHWTWSARHTGEFLGIPATGVRVEITGFEIVQVYDGKIHAAWVVQDNASLMAQLQSAVQQAQT